MEERKREDFWKDWQKILENVGEVMSKFGSINSGIAKEIGKCMKGIEINFEAIEGWGLENELGIGRAVDSIRGISDVIIPDTLAENVGKLAERLTEQMKPIIKFLGEWQDEN
jgi:hypothetical protein